MITETGSETRAFSRHHVRTQREAAICQPGGESLQEPDPLYVDLGPHSFQNCEKEISVVEATQAVVCCYRSSNRVRDPKQKTYFWRLMVQVLAPAMNSPRAASWAPSVALPHMLPGTLPGRKVTTALQCMCMAWEPSSTGRSAGPCLLMDRRQGDVEAGTEESRQYPTCPRSVRPAHEMPYPHPQQERHFSRNHEQPWMNVGLEDSQALRRATS